MKNEETHTLKERFISRLVVAILPLLQVIHIVGGGLTYRIMQRNDYQRRALQAKIETVKWFSTTWSEVLILIISGMATTNTCFPSPTENMFPFANGKGESLIGIDFGCGPGRNIVKYASTFRRLDGVNISEANLINAGEYLRQNGIDDSQLFLGSGNDLGAAPSGQI